MRQRALVVNLEGLTVVVSTAVCVVVLEGFVLLTFHSGVVVNLQENGVGAVEPVNIDRCPASSMVARTNADSNLLFLHQ